MRQEMVKAQMPCDLFGCPQRHAQNPLTMCIAGPHLLHCQSSEGCACADISGFVLIPALLGATSDVRVLKIFGCMRSRMPRFGYIKVATCQRENSIAGMVFPLPWVCSNPCSVHEPSPQEDLQRKHGCSNKNKIEDNRCKSEKKVARQEIQTKRRGGWLDQEMSAREQAQTFVAMSGFPMPFLP
eukprot:s107_g13.t1